MENTRKEWKHQPEPRPHYQVAARERERDVDVEENRFLAGTPPIALNNISPMDGWMDGRRETSFLSLSLYSFVYDGKRVVLTADGGDAAHQLSRGMEQKGGLAVFV